MRICILVLLFTVSLCCLGTTKEYADLTTAVQNQSVKIRAVSTGGLSGDNLKCRIRNLQKTTVYVRIPPGLHFISANSEDQDLFTVKEVLLAIEPQAEKTVLLKGFCMQASSHSPSANGIYTFNGYAPNSLKVLGDSLARYEPLAISYGQMFVWAITDHKKMYAITIGKPYLQAAKNVMKYVADLTQQPYVQVSEGATDALPSVEIFSKRTFLTFHNPVNQVASFKMFNSQGREQYVLFKDRKINHGVQEYEFSLNDVVPVGVEPVYYFRVINSAGKMLAEMKVDKNTVPTQPLTVNADFTFQYSLEKPVKEATLKVYKEDGTFVEQFKNYSNLPIGNYQIHVKFIHLFPPDTKFIAKLESPGGTVYKQQVIEHTIK